MHDANAANAGPRHPQGLLAIWSTGYARGFGGAERMVNALIRRRSSRPQILIADGNPREPLPKEYFASLPASVTLRVDTFPNPLLSSGPVDFAINVGRYVGAAARLWRFFRRSRPAIVHQHFVSLDVFLLALYRQFFDYRLIVTFCGGDLTVAQRSAAARFKIRMALRYADAVTAVSADMTAILRNRFGGRTVSCIPNGVDVSEVRDAAARAASRVPDGHFVFVGRLHRDKRVSQMITVFKQCLDAGCDRNLYIIGDGPERDILARLIAREDLGDRVVMLGALSHDEAIASLARARCLLLLSSEEGCPNVILEAMALGVPAIATRVGGVPDLIVDGRTGYLVPVDRPEEAVERILVLSRDPALASVMGRRGLEIAQDQLSLTSAVQKYSALYHSLQDGRPSAAAAAAECSGISSQ